MLSYSQKKAKVYRAKETPSAGKDDGRIGAGRGELRGHLVSTEVFAQTLSLFLQHPVVDQTGIDSLFSFELHWTPDETEPQLGGAVPPPSAVAAIDPNGPSLLTAVGEQLWSKADQTRSLRSIVRDWSPTGGTHRELLRARRSTEHFLRAGTRLLLTVFSNPGWTGARRRRRAWFGKVPSKRAPGLGFPEDTGRRLEVLRDLPNLRMFAMTWQAGVTDIGIAKLRFCDQLEALNLMGSPTHDRGFEALQGKAKLRSFSTGRLVTDATPTAAEFPSVEEMARGRRPPAIPITTRLWRNDRVTSV